MMNIKMSRRLVAVAALAGVMALGGCKGLFTVKSAGRIADSDLNSSDALSGLVAGMSWAMSEAINNSIETISIFSGDIWHAGSYDFGDIARGFILPQEVNTEWGDMQRARWVAEDGIDRMQKQILSADKFGTNQYVAQAYMWAGFANRMLGENVCAAVIDGGAVQSDSVYFSRAADEFTQAITIGQAANVPDVVTAAYAGRASVKAWQGDWAGAAQDAQQVPPDFVIVAPFSNELSNNMAYETHNRYEFSVYSTAFADHPDDPRIPWKIIYNADGSVARGANGSTPMYQQNKYPSLDSDVPLAKGTEMLELRAEAALRNNDISGAYDLMNQARAVYGMDPLPVATDMQQAWDDMHYERMATVWLENRHLWDVRRWYAASGPEHYDYLNGRDQCIPISDEEARSNPNVPVVP
jgi:starch-binding outer membrane protein, SusD/RagB family